MIATPPQICILGGGFSGLYTALHLSCYRWPQSAPPQITLVDQSDHFLFTPLLYELLTDELKSWQIAPKFEQLLADKGIHFCQAIIQGVDFPNRQVLLQGGRALAYDRLVLAGGKGNSLEVVPGAATYAYPFRTLADADRLQEQLRLLAASDRKFIRIAIAGGGASGVELACKLADRLKHQGRIRLIEQGGQILKDFRISSQKAAQRALARHRIRVDLNTSIEAVGADQLILSYAGQVETVPVDLVLWTVGTRARTWVSRLACPHDERGQLLVRSTLQVIGYPEVWALGDLASIQEAQGQAVPLTAQAAFQQAKVASRNLWASLTGRCLLAFHYQHLGEMLTLGSKNAAISSYGLHLEGSLAAVIRHWVYFLKMPTLRHRLQVAAYWLVKPVWQDLRSGWQGWVSWVRQLKARLKQ